MMLLVLGILAVGSAQAPQTPTDRPPSSADRSLLKIVSVGVQPANPGPDTLCKLRVRLRNSGTASASNLSFQVTVNGKLLGNFINHTFMSTLDAGKETEVALFNFWSSEYSRPYPGDGRLIIEVRLMGARWVDARSPNTATPGGPVQPLPAPFSVTLTGRDRR
jgi:CARDB protein